MKYLIIVYDGMADRPIRELGDRTPMEAARKPTMDALAADSLVGLVSHVPAGMVPESDTANLSILSYDPRLYSKGRSPLEAVSMGLSMGQEDVAFRANLVTLSDAEDYDRKTMLDHSSDEISTAEAGELMAALQAELGTPERQLHAGVSYRHCLLWTGASDRYPFARPHDIIGRQITDYLPRGTEGQPFYELMRRSYELLQSHPVNVARRARGLRAANSLWIWGAGKKPALPSFAEKWGLDAAVISAVDLIKGIALCAGMTSLDVPGATANIHTNFTGKAEAAMAAFRAGKDLVYIHIEAPDECGHRGETENKVRSIELIDERVLTPLLHFLRGLDEPFAILALPDHPTPVALRTHTMDPVPFMLYRSGRRAAGVPVFTEASAAGTGYSLADGTRLMGVLLER